MYASRYDMITKARTHLDNAFNCTLLPLKVNDIIYTFCFCRCFDVGNGIKPLSTISLCDYHTPTRMHAALNFALAYGEVAVSFSIAPPVNGRNEVVLYPIFVLQENGNVLIIWSWLDPER